MSYSQANWPVKLLLTSLTSEFSNLIRPTKTIYFISLLFFIFINNFLGLFPYTFTSPTHPVFGISFALPFWLIIICYSMKHQPVYLLAHLVPTGTPNALKPFMVLIEIIRNIIRPLTLTVRLTANIIAGHLLLTLAGTETTPSILIFTLIITAVVLIILLELGVAFIQAYVFSVLSTLYISEMDSISLNK
mmetsp:Transcript_31001/g.51151  ORF Transcript_31001/g.51151 Transcript_31001/m.51151 type:complete len:190 (-) Transcript_31001:9-578(-)